MKRPSSHVILALVCSLLFAGCSNSRSGSTPDDQALEGASAAVAQADRAARATGSPSDGNGLNMTSGDLQQLVTTYASGKAGVLGTIVQIDIPNREPVTAVYGYFDSTRTRPIKLDDKFIIGSITKTFTATLVLQLVETGKVDLNGRLVDYLPPDCAAVLSQVTYGTEITVGHALAHRSGILPLSRLGSFREHVLPDPSREWTLLEIVSRLPSVGEPGFKPGESFEYSNTNYLLLAGLIEHVTGEPYGESLQRRILRKIGLANTFLSEGPFGSNRPDVAHGYEDFGGKLYDGQAFSASWAIGAGGIISDADDLITYMKALTSGTLFQAEETFKRMIHGLEEDGSYGFGIETIKDSPFGPYYGHKGTFGNTSSVLYHFPAHGVTISTCQTFDGSAGRLRTDALMELVMATLLGVDVPRGHWPEDVLDYSELGFTIAEIATVEEYDAQGMVLRAKSDDGKLIKVRLKGKVPRTGRFQYIPSCVSLRYEVGNETRIAPCLAVGMIFKTKEGTEEHWVTSDQELKKITRTSMDENATIIIHTLFEVPEKSGNFEAVFS